VIILFNLLIGKAQINPENYPAFMQSAKIAFLIFAVFCFAGIFFSMARGNTRK